MMHIRRKVLINTLAVFLFIFLSEITVSAENISKNDICTVTVKVLNLRKSPDTNSRILAKIKYNEEVKIINSTKEWCKVNYNGIEGWISSSYIKISKTKQEQKTGKVNVDILKVRKKPGTTADVISKLQKGKTFQVLESSKNWYRIKTSDGISGWVCADYVTLVNTTEQRGANITISRGSEEELQRTSGKELKSSDTEEMPSNKEMDSQNINNEQLQSSSEEQKDLLNTKNEASLGQQIVDYARNFIGIKYKYGGNTPEEGFDCSGYTKYIYSNFNISLERTAASQALQGSQISIDNLCIGDLVFFDTNGNGKDINHVGIYIGDNMFIHASSPRYDVTITSLSDAYYIKSYITARRILKD